MSLCVERRGVQKNMHFSQGQVSMHWEMPMNEVVMDFFDRLKSVSRGFASLDYSFSHFEAANLVKLDILINGDRVDALASIVHRNQAQTRGRSLDGNAISTSRGLSLATMEAPRVAQVVTRRTSSVMASIPTSAGSVSQRSSGGPNRSTHHFWIPMLRLRHQVALLGLPREAHQRLLMGRLSRRDQGGRPTTLLQTSQPLKASLRLSLPTTTIHSASATGLPVLSTMRSHPHLPGS